MMATNLLQSTLPLGTRVFSDNEICFDVQIDTSSLKDLIDLKLSIYDQSNQKSSIKEVFGKDLNKAIICKKKEQYRVIFERGIETLLDQQNVSIAHYSKVILKKSKNFILEFKR